MRKSKNSGLDILKRIAGTIYIPAVIYAVFFIVAHKNGQTYFGDSNTWRNIILNTGATATTAYALATQIKNGRFDFSGGAIMTLGALLSINIASHVLHNGFFYLLVSIAVCTALSVIAALIYVNGKIPVIICTVGAAILFESLTLVYNRGQGVSISSDTILNFFGKKAGPLCALTVLSGLIYLVFGTFTTAGKKAQLLASNQTSAVNIGIDERKNVVQTFIVSGFFTVLPLLFLRRRHFRLMSYCPFWEPYPSRSALCFRCLWGSISARFPEMRWALFSRLSRWAP